MFSSQVLLMFGPLGLSLAPYVNSSRTLSRWITPIANWYANASGYRKYGFKYDDLCMQSQLVRNRHLLLILLFLFSVVEETPDVQRVC